MDALEFLKYAKKMCARYSDERNGAGFCQGCPALLGEDEICILNYQYKSCEPDKAVEAVEKYAKEYPIETNQDRFLKIFPEARQKDGLIDICPRTVSKEHRSKSTEYGGCGLYKMVSIAVRNMHCEILCFTKKYGLVNYYLNNVGDLPPNLHMIFSAWVDLKMVNPFHLPEAHVLYRDGTTTAREDAKKCGGNCTECACISGGCWSLKKGEQVVLKEH